MRRSLLAFSRGDYRRARESWLKAAGATRALEDRQNALAKAARAELQMNYAQQAVKNLQQALALGKSDRSGMLHYYCGAAFQATGNRKEAAEQYLAAYQTPGNAYQLAALYRLVGLYGRGTSSQARGSNITRVGSGPIPSNIAVT